MTLSVIILLLILAALGFGYYRMKTRKNTVTLAQTGIMFELPQGYVAYEREGFEGGYAATVSIGKEVTPGHITYAGIEIRISASVYDEATEKQYTPHEYVDVIYAAWHTDFGATYTKLFDNKAVRYTSAADSAPIITGFVTLNRPQITGEYSVEVAANTYGSGVALDQKLFDTVVQSLRTQK